LDTTPKVHPLFEPEPDKEPETELDYYPEIVFVKPKKKRKPKTEVINKPKK
jgi:hypothetical protein